MGRKAAQRRSKRDRDQRRPRTFPWRVVVPIAVAAVMAIGWGVWYFSPAPDRPIALKPATKNEGTLPASLGLSWDAMDDPREDCWTTEAFSAEADRVLKQLSDLFANQPDPQQLQPLVADSFSCDPLLPKNLRTVYQDDALVVERDGASSHNETALHIVFRFRGTFAGFGVAPGAA